MLDHVSIVVTDLTKSAAFYDAVMAPLGVPCVWRLAMAIGYGTRNSPHDDGHSYLTIRSTGDLSGLRDAPGRHWCFRAPSRAAVDAFHAAGLAAAGHCEGPPGVRPAYHESYYAAFISDPDGNRLEAVCHRRPTP